MSLRALHGSRVVRRAATCIALSLLCINNKIASAAEISTDWVGTTNGSWFDATRWTTNPFFPDNGTPSGTDYAVRVNASGPAFTLGFNGAATVNSLVMNSTSATLGLSGGALTVANLVTIGGNSVVDQTAGKFLVNGVNPAMDVRNNGLYQISDGTLQFGKSLAVGLTLGDTANFLMSSTAYVTGDQLNVGTNRGNGTFIQNGGEVALNDYIALADDINSSTTLKGYYALNTGTLSATYLYVGATGMGTFLHSGGASSFSDFVFVGADPGSTGRYTLSGGTLNSAALLVGYRGTGTFTQTAGVNNVGGVLRVGRDPSGVGTYALSAGATLNALDTSIGYLGHGTMNQSGGVMAVNGILYVGNLSGSRGNFNLSGGTLTASNEVIGSGGVGTFNQSGGRHAIANTLTIGSSGSLSLSGGTLTALSLFNAGDVNQSGGIATFSAVSGSGVLTVSGTAEFHSNFVRQAVVTAMPSGRIDIAANGTAAAYSRIGVLSLGGGTLNLADNDLILEQTPLPLVEQYIFAARNFGAWDQPGLTSSAAATNPDQNTSLGAISAVDYSDANGGTILFDVQVIVPTNVLVKYTWYGDTNLDGIVDFDDYVRTDTGFNNGDQGWFNGDFNYDGLIDYDDYVLIDYAFNSQTGVLSAALEWLNDDEKSLELPQSPGLSMVIDHYNRFGDDYANAFIAAVPEPAVGMIVAAPIIGMRRRRRSA